MYRIVNKRRLNDSVTLMEVEAPLVARKCAAGQFICFRLDEYGERVPLTVAGYDRDAGTVTIIFQIVGKTTMMLGLLEAGDAIADFVGPLGNAVDFSGLGRVLVIGGGVGCTIALPIARGMSEAGISVDMVAGFRTKDRVILENEMWEACENLYITTDDGTYGLRGNTTDMLHKLVNAGNSYDRVDAVGPEVMMKYVSRAAKRYGLPVAVSLNPIMVDGAGMCGCCRVTVGGEVKFACVDGPEFDGALVDWDELIQRNSFYKELENEAMEHVCRLTGELRITL